MQFDVYKNPRGGTYPLLVDLQADMLQRLPTRMVAPLVPAKRYAVKAIARLDPVVTIRGVDYIVVMQDMASLPATALAEHVDSLARARPGLIAALDLLFTGI